MSAPAFTPGPWNIQRSGEVWSDNHPIAERIVNGPWGDEGVWLGTGERFLAHHWGTVATEEAKGNLHLIAAAPDMFTALSIAEGFVEAVTAPNAGKAMMLTQIRDALAKARGGA